MVVQGGEAVATNVVGRGVGLQSRDDGTLCYNGATLPASQDGGRRKEEGLWQHEGAVCALGFDFPPERERGVDRISDREKRPSRGRRGLACKQNARRVGTAGRGAEKGRGRG